MTNASLQRAWPPLALIASAAMLAAAHAFETLGGYAPCELCLRQREVYWAAMAVAAVGAVLTFALKRRPTGRVFDAILGLVFLTGAVVAAYHAGVEWRFWPGPAICSGGVVPQLTTADIMNALSHRGHAPSCEDAAWRLAGISMAGYNALISLALASLSFYAAARSQAPGEENV